METELYPEAEPSIPVNEVVVAAVQVEPDTPVDSTTAEPDEPPAVEEQVTLPWSTEGLNCSAEGRPGRRSDLSACRVRVSKPSWNDVVQYSKEVKTLWSFWPRLNLRDGLLQRKFTSIEQQSEFWQTIIPSSHRQEFIEWVHAGSAGGHFGVKKTSAAVQSRAYSRCLRYNSQCHWTIVVQ